MYFPFLGLEIVLLYLILLGFIVGFLGGFFGVGGGSIYVPLLFFVGIPIPIAVGTSLALIAGKSIVGMFTHLKLGNVDIKLGIIMAIAIIPRTELGALIIEFFESQFPIDVVDRIIIIFYTVLLGFIAIAVFIESIIAIRKEQINDFADSDDIIAFKWIFEKIKAFPIGPHISIKDQEHQVSIWVIGIISFFTGLLSGFLGVGGGFFRVPLLVYFLGVSTTIAIGTDLLEIIISAGFSTFSHSLKGNVDFMVALITSLWGCVGVFLERFLHNISLVKRSSYFL